MWTFTIDSFWSSGIQGILKLNLFVVLIISLNHPAWYMSGNPPGDTLSFLAHLFKIRLQDLTLWLWSHEVARHEHMAWNRWMTLLCVAAVLPSTPPQPTLNMSICLPWLLANSGPYVGLSVCVCMQCVWKETGAVDSVLTCGCPNRLFCFLTCPNPCLPHGGKVKGWQMWACYSLVKNMHGWL